MACCIWRIPAVLLFLSATWASGQQLTPTTDSAPIVQPGAPGQSSRTISAAAATVPVRSPSEADTSFMQGMIMHHSQAVEMTDLMSTRTRNKALLSLGKRISISQTDEIRYMKQWLEDRGKPASAGDSHMDHMGSMNMGDMKGMGPMEHTMEHGMEHTMNHMDMSSMPLMPGMLSPQQMRDLANAKGTAFDHLFLTGMIQHHTGALVMVQDLFDTPGAGQDAVLFDFATDIDNTQRAEIRIMQGMLKEKK
jgi:uncharacterized protein (DUF305 family)